MTMDAEAQRLTKALRGFDSSLFVVRDREGRLVVYAERLLRPDSPELVLYLTVDWSERTPARDWGVLRIIERLQEIRKSPLEALDECNRHNERVRASRERQRRNDDEAFLKDIRRSIARAFNDFNTSTVRKVDRRRETEKKYGYR